MLETKVYDMYEVRQLKRRLRTVLGSAYLRKFPHTRKGMRYATIAYFFSTGHDTSGGNIYREAKKLAIQGTETDKRLTMVITKEIEGREVERIAKDLMNKYRTSRFIAKLHRDLRLKGHDYSYAFIQRFFQTKRDTTGGKLLELIVGII